MELTRITFKNFWRDGAIVNYSSQEPQFPAIDTQRDTLDQQWRTENDTDDPTYITNNLGAAEEYNHVSLRGHNIPNTATIKIRGADDAAITVNVVEDIITWNAENISFYLTAARTKQYAQIQITTPGNPDNYITIATIVVGKYYEFNSNYDWGYEEGDEDFSEIQHSDALVAFAQEKDEIFVGKYSFVNLDDTSAEKVQELNTQNKRVHGLIVCFDSTTPNSTSYWVRLSSINKPRPTFINIWSWTMNIFEVK